MRLAKLLLFLEIYTQKSLTLKQPIFGTKVALSYFRNHWLNLEKWLNFFAILVAFSKKHGVRTITQFIHVKSHI
ncbi:hypothetical protein VIBNIAM115_560026 [Vibrio nigripulchritudo AM115]|nr:hypothetical protein VIBNIAM115_560026 [Vibrio nigripulchritudo AM115]